MARPSQRFEPSQPDLGIHAGMAFWSLAALVLILPATAEAEDRTASRRQRDHQTLSELGIEPTTSGARAYLESLVPVGDPNELADSLILRLGHDDFSVREKAANELLSLPSLSREKVELATRHKDAEIRWRARVVLGRLGIHGTRAMQAALREISRQPPDGTQNLLLRLADHEWGESQQTAIWQALAEVVDEGDLTLLEGASREGRPLARLAASYALLRIDDGKGRDALSALVGDGDPHIVLAAGKHLGNAGDRRCLAALVRLLESEEPVIAAESGFFLSALTGKDFSFPSHGDSAAQEKWVSEARSWLAAEGATARLTFPVAEPVIARGDLSGNTLVATGGLGKVVELDAAGVEVWKYDIISWSAEKLSNGNVLIASYHANQVLEVNRNGEVVWSRGGINAMRAKPLADGHLLIADYGGKRVVELSEDRQEVWTVKTPDNCFDAERLPSGNTVFACPNLVREVDADGETVRELAVEGRVNSVQVLPNGSWLLANFQKNAVQEFDRQGKLAWSLEELAPCDAFRLRNGKTLVTSNRRAIEIAADGKTIREIMPARYGCVRQ